MEILAYLSGFENALLFKNTENQLLLLYKFPEKAAADAARLRERFAGRWTCL